LLDGLNRYAYVQNNPVKYVDPTGHTHEESWWEAYEDYYSQDGNENSEHPGTTGDDGDGNDERKEHGDGTEETVVPPIVVEPQQASVPVLTIIGWIGAILEPTPFGEIGMGIATGSLAGKLAYDIYDVISNISPMGVNMPESRPGSIIGKDTEIRNRQDTKQVVKIDPPKLPTDPNDPNNKPKHPFLKWLMDAGTAALDHLTPNK
jgi:hypothetical protein